MAPRSEVPLAVALRWDGADAPRVTASGRGELATHIVALAHAHGVPLDDDPVLVEALAQVEVGQPIPQALFVAVAEVLAFAYRVRGRVPAAARSSQTPI